MTLVCNPAGTIAIPWVEKPIFAKWTPSPENSRCPRKRTWDFEGISTIARNPGIE
jgi:hypothetical protein